MPVVKRVEVKLTAEGAAGVKEKLDMVARRADELGRLEPTIKIDVDAAAAEAKLAILRAELQKTTTTVGGKTGSGFLSGITSGLQSIIGLGPAAIPVLAGIAAAVLAIVVYLGSLITELSAAAIGIGAFAAFAIPTFMKIVSGIQAVSGAADATARAAAWKAIPKAIQPAVQAGLQLKGAFDKLVTALQPTVVRVFGDALKIVGDLLPQLLPIALSVGKAIDGLLRAFDSVVKSAGFKAFISQMDALAGPAVKAIGQGIGQIAGALGDLVTAGSGPQGLLLLRTTFTLIAGSIRVVAQTIRLAGDALNGFIGAIATVAGPVIGIVKRITDAFLTMISTIARIGSHIPGFGWLKGIADAADNAKKHADTAFAGIAAGAARLKTAIANAPIIYKLQGNITDLQNKVAAAKAQLKTVPPSQTSRILGNITQLQQQIAAARAALNAINGQSATVYVNVVTSPIQGPHAAAGGYHSGGTWVGELGPEFVNLPPGSYVNTAASSRTAATTASSGSGGDGGGNLVINNLYVTAPDGPALLASLQDLARKQGPLRLKIRS